MTDSAFVVVARDRGRRGGRRRAAPGGSEAATAIERLITVAGFDPVMAGGLDDAGRLGLPDGDLHQ